MESTWQLYASKIRGRNGTKIRGRNGTAKKNILVWSDEMKLNCDMECMESYSHPP
jgi:hypothetical protein